MAIKKKPQFKKGQVVKMTTYKHEYVLITAVWPWEWRDDEDGKVHQNGWGYTFKTAQTSGTDSCHEKWLRKLTVREKSA